MERPGDIILDASVIVKWFVDEEFTDKSLQILDDYIRGEITVYSVQLMPYEVSNALRYNPAIGKEELIRVGLALRKFQIVLYPIIDGMYESAINIAIDSGTTVYDAAYLSLAIEMGAPLYTADQKFMNKLGERYRVVHISSYK